MAGAPIRFQWDGEAMVPAGPMMARKADDEFVVGETYDLVEHQDRSKVSHDHQFASISEGYKSLPERLKNVYPTEEHMRKAALIDGGFYNQQVYGCASIAEAHRTAAIIRQREEFSVCVVDGNNCIVRTAKSQKMRGIGAMNKQEFQASKDYILAFIAELIGSDAEALGRERAA